MKRGWTADCHLGHSNIIKYCDRPFKDCGQMNTAIIRNTNQRALPGDTVIHVGDFCMKGSASKHLDWVTQFHCNMVFLKGNHDANNGVKTIGKWLFTRMSSYQVFVSHIPYHYTQEERTAKSLLPAHMIEFIESSCDFAICGHVHEKWLWSPDSKIPCLNVGVDQHKFMPIFDDEVIGLYEKYKRGVTQ